MREMLVPFTFTLEAQAAANGAVEFETLCGFTLVGVSLCAAALGGSPTAFDIDIQDDGSDIVTAVAANSAGTSGTWKTPTFGGTETPVYVAAGSAVEIDVNFAGGSSPTADFCVILWALVDA